MQSKSKCRFSFVLALFATFAVAGAALAADKIIYFTAGSVPTTGEKAEIAAIAAQAAKPYTVAVRNSRKALLRATNETSDYVAGAIPPNYRDGGIDSGTPFQTVYTYTNPPDPATLPSAQAILRNGDSIALTGGGAVVVAVSGNTITVSSYTAPDGGA